MLWSRLLAIAPFFLWGSGMVVMKGPLSAASPMFIAIMRLLPAGLIVLLALALRGRRDLWPKTTQAWLWILVFALLDGSLFEGLLIVGLQDTGAGLGSVLIDTQPAVVAILATLFYQERLGWVGWSGIALALVGIGTIGLTTGFSFTAGSGLMLGAAIAMAVSTVMMREIAKHIDPVVATGWHLLLGSIPLIGISAFTETQQWQGLDAAGWLGVAYIAIFTSALAYALFFYAASQENLTQYSSLTFLTPVFALLLGYGFLHESLSLRQWLGVALTLIAVYIVHQRETIVARWQRFVVISRTADYEPAPETVRR